MPVRFRDDALRHFVACRRNDGNDHHLAGILSLEFSHDGAGRDDLAHRRRVHPDRVVIGDLSNVGVGMTPALCFSRS